MVRFFQPLNSTAIRRFRKLIYFPAVLFSLPFCATTQTKLFGFRLSEPHAKTLKNAEGLKELRVKAATDICRLFYFHHKEKLYICTSGYIKKTDKTDEQEIQRALIIRNNYLKEHGV